jgi:hypothetical protein
VNEIIFFSALEVRQIKHFSIKTNLKIPTQGIEGIIFAV